MDSISRLLLATHPPDVVEYSKILRLQSILLLVGSALGVIVAVINFSRSPYYSIISGSFFMASSLAGVPVGVYAYNTSRKVKSPYVFRYKRMMLIYAITYVIFLLFSLILQYLKMRDKNDDETVEILIGVLMLVLFIAIVPCCLVLVKSSYKFCDLVIKYERNPLESGQKVTPDQVNKLSEIE